MSDKLAKVGERIITKSDLAQLKHALGEEAKHFEGEEGEARLLDEIIRQELLYLDAKDQKFDEEPAFRASMEEIEKQQLGQYAFAQLLGSVQVLPQEVESYFVANQASFSEEEAKNPDQTKARIYQQLTLLRQQAAYINHTNELEKKFPVIRETWKESKEEE